MKKVISGVFVVLFFIAGVVAPVCAFDADDMGIVEPTADMDLVCIQNSQSKTVTVDLAFPLDFAVTPVLVIGKGPLRVSMSRTNTTGELVYLYLKGFDDPPTDFNCGITPLSLSVSSTNGLYEYRLGMVISGILYSTEPRPYEYKLSFSF